MNQAYMAGLMAAPMAILELGLMGAMYAIKRINLLIILASVPVLLLCWLGIRNQLAVDDKSFLRSMIPHHAGAILICNQASISDGEIRKLCGEIVKSQQQKIDKMKAMVRRLSSESRSARLRRPIDKGESVIRNSENSARQRTEGERGTNALAQPEPGIDRSGCKERYKHVRKPGSHYDGSDPT